jgi:hypothetical protein
LVFFFHLNLFLNKKKKKKKKKTKTTEGKVQDPLSTCVTYVCTYLVILRNK